MHKETVRVFEQSLLRCTSQVGFAHDFYRRLFASSEEMGAHFEGLDMERQTRLLQAALHISLEHAHGSPLANSYFAYLGKKHRGFPPLFYDVWLDTLLESVAAFDEQFDAATEQAWRQVIQPVIERLHTD